jgi:hypothetical protein
MLGKRPACGLRWCFGEARHYAVELIRVDPLWNEAPRLATCRPRHIKVPDSQEVEISLAAQAVFGGFP